MSSMKIEVAASSSPFSYVSLRDHNRSTNNKGYIQPQNTQKNQAGVQDGDSSCLPSHNSTTDESCMPTSSLNSTVTSDTEDSNHRNRKTVVRDDSWLPVVNDSNGKHVKNTNKLENHTDYSWLPSSFIDKNKNKQKNNNNNRSKTKNLNKNSPQKKPRNDHWALAREVVFSRDQQKEKTDIVKNTSQSSWIQQDSPSKSTYVVESPNPGGVSSLLQRWSDLAETKNSNKNNKSSLSSTRNNPGSMSYENNNDNSPSSLPNTINDSISDWESDSNDTNLGGAEKKKIRVVDIVKKLSQEEELAASHAARDGTESLPHIRTTLQNKQTPGEQNGTEILKVPRHLVLGRQPFDKFIMQMEHHKNYELKCLVERKAVSKFSHRESIQASLRFKILRLGAEPKPETKRHRRCISKSLESNNRLDIMDLRERFNSGGEKGAMETRKHKRNDIKSATNEETSDTITTDNREVAIKMMTKTTTGHKKQAHQPKIEHLISNQSTQYSKSFGKDVLHKAKFVDSSSNFAMFKEDNDYNDENKICLFEDEGQFMSARTSYGEIEDMGFSDFEETNYTNNKQELENFNDWETNGYSQTPIDLDGNELYDLQLFDTNYDWISQISRSKSDWDYMRQARYQEMLESTSVNGDIQRLLERKSVSSFLGSGLRDLIDQLMVSRIEQSHVQVEKKDIIVREKVVSMKDVDEDGDCMSKTETKCSEHCAYVDQTTYPERSWRPNDVGNNSETTTTSPLLEHSVSSNHSQNNSTPQSPFPIAHQTIEMELIYDLRGHMEQLHQEITELRKSIKSCVNMQVKMQHSFKQNVIATTTTPPAKKRETKPPGSIKHICSICRVMQVDSLLYRCGHMCTCFKCALEMQHTSGKCSVCEAPIVDVVKAFAHES